MYNKLSRRRFLQASSLALAGQWADRQLPFLMEKPPVRHLGVQLYSVRDDVGRDPAGTLKALAAMGYKEVEGFGYNDGKWFGLPLKDFNKLLKDNGLRMPSTHHGMSLKDFDPAKKTLSDGLKRSIDQLAGAGIRYIICPWVDMAERAQVTQLTALCQAVGDYVHQAGAQFAYHNHDFEFTAKGPDGRLLYEWLLQEVDPKRMVMEMDLYWVVYAGQKPSDWFKRFPGRFKLCHVKDMAKTPKRETVEVGDGSIDFPGIFKERKLAGFQYYIVELEHYKTTPLQGVQRGRENFLKMKF